VMEKLNGVSLGETGSLGLSEKDRVDVCGPN